MSRIESLQESVRKSGEKVEKIKGTIERHKRILAKKTERYDIEYKQEEIKGAEKKLAEAVEIHQNWIQKLSKEQDRIRFIEGSVPPILKRFMEEWKKLAFTWHINRYNTTLQLEEQLAAQEKQAKLRYIETSEYHSRWKNPDGSWQVDPERLLSHHDSKMQKALKEIGLDYRSIQNKIAQHAGGAVMTMKTYYNEQERLAWLEKTLEREKIFKLLDMVERINKYIGQITDGSHLSIGNNGSINGLVHGEKGSAYLETIGAGGYAVQCFHFRVLVKPVKN